MGKVNDFITKLKLKTIFPSFIMLSNENIADKKEFIQASDKLEVKYADLIRRFYELIEAKRYTKSIPVSFYEEILIKPQSELTRKILF